MPQRSLLTTKLRNGFIRLAFEYRIVNVVDPAVMSDVKFYGYPYLISHIAAVRYNIKLIMLHRTKISAHHDLKITIISCFLALLQ